MQRYASLLSLASLILAATLAVAWADEKPAPATNPTTAPTTNPATLLIWNGETHNTGGGWVDHKDKETIQTQTTESHSPKTALAFTADGDKWHGCGWNWTNWKTTDATDITPYQYLSFWAKVTADTKPTELRVSLASIKGKMTNQIDALKYCPKLLDGQWQQVVIPLKDMLADQPDFDPAKVWEIQLGNWNQTPVKFTVYLDDIAFTNAPPQPAK